MRVLSIAGLGGFVMPLQLIIAFFLMNLLSADDFGRYSYASTMLTLIALIYSFGLTLQIAKRQNRSELSLRFFVVHLIAVYILSEFIVTFTSLSQITVLIFLLGKFVYAVAVGLLRARRMFLYADAILPISQPMLFLLAVSFYGDGLNSEVLLLLVGASFAVPAAIVFFAKVHPFHRLASENDFDVGFIGITSVMLLQRSLAQTPILLMGYLGHFEEVALLKLVFLIMTIPGALAAVANPILITKVSHGLSSDRAEIISVSRQVSIVAILISAIGVSVFLADTDFWIALIPWGTNDLISLIVLGLFLASLSSCFGTVGSILFGNDDLRYMALVSAIFIMLDLFLLYTFMANTVLVVLVHGLVSLCMNVFYHLRSQRKWGMNVSLFGFKGNQHLL